MNSSVRQHFPNTHQSDCAWPAGTADFASAGADFAAGAGLTAGTAAPLAVYDATVTAVAVCSRSRLASTPNVYQDGCPGLCGRA
ncbi:MAG: hypothetical protein M3Y77_10245 [Actinomycetota bacterium]|nr:hypothetical protein [Actinomycetota bacterium]